ncbi:hypothetical protein DMN91_007149 [Ooceraea biroi]|uniref:BRCT domain-containing protein n=1 Tax=Ooceraea biroi TaxID=2015173 RepID=A0A3L8DL24_OOCBI|nr:uncharacterized protein LOC105279847 [Ooceraea biroi]XP_011338209.2 uncharacterized protein LOC105279847 [Ooceraea biroi]XP_011338210.2 uncharacterized protein LOC105279847 [Ooceraea biroi]RLU20538.1 hypothetical protein DMN91_007149 [Ooceraea biroi]
MSNLKKTDSCIPDTQETYYEGANEGSKEGIINETQSLAFTESQDFRLVDSGGDDSIMERMQATQDEKNDQESIKRSDLQIQDASQLVADNKAVTANDSEDEIIKNKELLEDESVKKTEKAISSDVLDSEEKKGPLKEDIQDVPPLSSSPSPGTVGNVKAVDAKHKAESSVEPLPKISRTMSDDMLTDDKESKDMITDDKGNETQELVVENEPIKKTEQDTPSNVRDSKTDELSDEDEVIQGTPPRCYSSTKSIEVASLKRKGSPFDEQLSAKILRMPSAEDMTSGKKFEDEESRQSCESNDSYQDLFKNAEKNIIIEETQDPTNQEFAQKILESDSLKSTLKHTTDDDKAQEHRFEQTNQEEGADVFSTKCCDVEKDENLNVSARLTDTSANDSTTVNFMNESNSHVEDNNLSVEAKEDVSVTSVAAVDEKARVPDETADKSAGAKDLEMAIDEMEKTQETHRVKPTEKTADKKNEKETSITQTKASDEAQPSVRGLASRSRSSVELICDVGNKSEPEVVEIDEDDEKIVLDSSAEVIYDRKNSAAKPEVVEIVDDSHEDGEKIVLDSFGEGVEVQMSEKYKNYHEGKPASDFSYRSMESMKESSLDSKSATDAKKLVNGNAESRRYETDVTLSLGSDNFSDCNTPPAYAAKSNSNVAAKKSKDIFLGSKDVDNSELISISDNEMSNVEEKNKPDLIHSSALGKPVQMEREIDMYVKFKCTLLVDENTKEILSRELTAVQCETGITESMLLGKQKNEDSQASLADISDNKESSPGSVNSNPQLFQLNRLSMVSSISSSSSASSAASLAAKMNQKNFPMPLGPAKHAKKHSQDVPPTLVDRALDETCERLKREWKNHPLLVTTILNYLNAELSSSVAVPAASVSMDAYVNVSNERLDDPHHPHHHLLEKNGIRSSTPEVSSLKLTTTPRTTKKNKGVKRARSKPTKSSVAQTNGKNSSKNTSDVNMPILHSEVDAVASPSRKKLKIESTSDSPSVNNANDVLTNSSPQSAPVDSLIGRTVFAKWSDNNYYPGIASDRVKGKYKVNFYDGKSKVLIPEFVIPIPKILREGLSVYATSKVTGYDSCGIIVDVQAKPNDDEDVYYTVEADDGERLHVQVREISLSSDQAQVLKEELISEDNGSVPSTPRALGQVTLDNMVDGKRRSKRIGTPILSKSSSNQVRASGSASKAKAEPSVSGMSGKLKKKRLSENESMSSDSNVESMQDECVLRGVQREIIGTLYEQVVKGPQSRIKGKPRSKKKVVEDEQTIATLGPIPPANSSIFKGMSFILTCVSLDALDRYQHSKAASSATSNVETEATETEAETENEDDWTKRPFVRERLHTQITAGGGKVYENFDQIPKEEYKNTKLIANVPNTTAKAILCLSVDIPAYNHKWIIRCCSEGKLVNEAEEALPTGWSLYKQGYVEMFQVAGNKPLSKIVVIIPNLIYDKEFTTFWRQVCENAGAVVLIAEHSGSMELVDFDSDVVVVSNKKCPSWAVDRAGQLQIPVLSTTWVVQCLIEGKRCPCELHPRYKYNYTN